MEEKLKKLRAIYKKDVKIYDSLLVSYVKLSNTTRKQFAKELQKIVAKRKNLHDNIQLLNKADLEYIESEAGAIEDMMFALVRKVENCLPKNKKK